MIFSPSQIHGILASHDDWQCFCFVFFLVLDMRCNSPSSYWQSSAERTAGVASLSQGRDFTNEVMLEAAPSPRREARGTVD